MQFSHVVPLSPGSRADQRAIEAHATSLNLSPEQLSVMRAVVSWGLLLTTTERTSREQVREYIRLTGGAVNLKGLVTRASRHDTSQVKQLMHRLLVDVGRGNCCPEWLSHSPVEEVRRAYPESTNSQAKLLQALVKHRLRLDSLDLAQLSKMLPFPLDEGSYLWRFIAGGSQTPQHAVRHLAESTPFLVTMENLIRGLSKEPHHFIEIDLVGNVGCEDEATHAVLGVINCSRDFYGPHVGRDKPHLQTLFIPRLPFLSVSHIPPIESPELGRALYGWLMFGDSRPEILWRVTLPPGREQLLQKWHKQVATINEQIRECRLQLADVDAGAPIVSEVRGALDKLERRLREKERFIAEAEDERDQIIPIGKQLAAFAKLNGRIREFRKELGKVLESGGRPVFCFVHGEDIEGQSVSTWIDFLDDAMTPVRPASSDPQRDKVVAVLRGSSFVFSSGTAVDLRNSWKRRENSYSRQNYRRFSIEASDFNSSVRELLSGVVPERTAPELRDLVETMLVSSLVPGVATQSCLSKLAQRDLKKNRLVAVDYFSYVCEVARTIPYDTMLKMLQHMHSLGVTKIPEKVIDICEARFGLQRRLFDAYHEYSGGYRPERFGQPNGVFEEATSFGSFLRGGLDTLGMSPELEELERALCESQVVAIVDSTGYYPQFQGSSAWAPVVTTEVWGEYVPPAMRLVRSLASRIMKGQVDPLLRHSSMLIPVVADDKEHLQQKMLQMLLGLESSQGVAKKELNKIVAEVARYNEKSILVLDATQVKSIDDYLRLLATLKSFQLKTILCTRQQFPVEGSVFLDPFLREGLVDRILAEPAELQHTLELKRPPDRALIELAVQHVRDCAPPQADPLHLSLQVLSFAATHARTLGESTLVRPDLVEATSKIFNVPPPERTARYLEGIHSFEREAARVTLGQQGAIEELATSMRQHIQGLRPERSPQVLMLAGPTGTGKTMLVELLAKNMSLPLLMIEGSQYTSHHQISRLVGSPADYRGPDEGKLYTFADKHPEGIVFLDEFEKMEASFLPYLMNFLDKGLLESGAGKVVHRPVLTILLASNAGAGRLRPGMETRTIKEIIGSALSRDPEKPMDWLVARMQVIPVLALSLPSFKEAIRKSLLNTRSLKGVWVSNLELVGVDDSACELLFQASRDVCRFDPDGSHGFEQFGFHAVAGAGGSSDDLFIDMRHVERAATRLMGRSLEKLVREQCQAGRHRDRTRVWPFRLVGDAASGTIRAELVQ